MLLRRVFQEKKNIKMHQTKKIAVIVLQVCILTLTMLLNVKDVTQEKCLCQPEQFRVKSAHRGK
jgi:hypothetical protein